ncbi:hypothetical protein PROFUN_13280 [Planoprotostelium fungivorum]|uniref:Uncharacterized protein n=1 Tax=Planoprotostelium fungivorum TaxID=1890364 RepID=A0A2P6N4U7_9EUKA|nr:hypothetical protein PROFUN_13280 [Planoprotostelium fungivorum]
MSAVVEDVTLCDWRQSTKSNAERFNGNLTIPLDDSNSVLIDIKQSMVDSIDTLGATVWDGVSRRFLKISLNAPQSIVLARYLQRLSRDTPILQNKKVLEIGSGAGLLGISAALLGGCVTFTDYAVFDLLRHNIVHNLSQDWKAKHSIRRLKWGESYSTSYLKSSGDVDDQSTSSPSAPFDVIIASDLVYYPFLINPLVRTLETLCYGGIYLEDSVEISVEPVTVKSPLILFSAENHNEHSINTFTEALSKRFHCEKVPPTELDQVFQHPDIYVWTIKTKE